MPGMPPAGSLDGKGGGVSESGLGIGIGVPLSDAGAGADADADLRAPTGTSPRYTTDSSSAPALELGETSFNLLVSPEPKAEPS